MEDGLKKKKIDEWVSARVIIMWAKFGSSYQAGILNLEAEKIIAY